MASSHPTLRQRQPPNERPEGDAWVDQVADEVQALLREHGLEMELCVWYDPVTHVAPYCSPGTPPGTSSSPSVSLDSASLVPLPARI